MPTATETLTAHKRKGQARLTNGRDLLPSVDGRSVWARVMRDVMAMVSHCGGADYISEPRRLQARRVAALEAELIYLEDTIARTRAAGEEPSAGVLELYTRIANGQRRHLECLGLDRVARDVTPDLQTYLAQTEAEGQPAAISF